MVAFSSALPPCIVWEAVSCPGGGAFGVVRRYPGLAWQALIPDLSAIANLDRLQSVGPSQGDASRPAGDPAARRRRDDQSRRECARVIWFPWRRREPLPSSHHRPL